MPHAKVAKVAKVIFAILFLCDRGVLGVRIFVCGRAQIPWLRLRSFLTTEFTEDTDKSVYLRFWIERFK